MSPRASVSSVLRVLAALSIAVPSAVRAEGPDEKCEVGAPAPAFTIRRLNPSGPKPEFFALKRFVGADPDEPKRFVVLSFGASYCEPCRRELSELVKLAPRLEAANVALAVVVMDREAAGIEIMRKLTVEELQLPFPVLTDHTGLVATRYRANPLPFLVVIDSTGVVRAVRSGFTDTSMAELARALELAPEPTAAGKGAKTRRGSDRSRTASPDPRR